MSSEQMRITKDELAKCFPGGIPIVAMKILAPEQSQPLTTAEVRQVLLALSALEPSPAPTVKGEVVEALRAQIAAVAREEAANGAACGWRSCTGCHENHEGVPQGQYSTLFGVHVGSGCGECGGLGAVWEYWTADTLDQMACEVTALASAEAAPPSDALAEAVSVMRGLATAGRTVLDGLHARIDQAPSTAKPVFNGIADLHDELGCARDFIAKHGGSDAQS